jgi:tetratricopeptide (TPR) repeat protein
MRLDPIDACAYQVRGKGHRGLGELTEAEADWAAAVKLDGNAAPTHRLLADLRRQRGAWQPAADSYTEVIRLRPRDPWAWYLRADVRAEQGEWRNAADDLGRAIELQEDPARKRAWREQHGLALLAAGDAAAFDDICAALNRDHQARPEDVRSAYAAVWLAVLKPQSEPAAADLVARAQPLLRDYPDATAARTALGAASYRAGRLDDAIRHLETAIRAQGRRGEPEALFLLAMARQARDEPDKARAAFDRGATGVKGRLADERRRGWSERLRWQLLRWEAEKLLGKEAP